jgi:hypothetical protein
MTIANHLERLSETIREESSKPESLRESGASDDAIRRAENLALEMRRGIRCGGPQCSRRICSTASTEGD